MVHTQLEVWKCSMKLANKCYRLTDNFPSIDKYGLAKQIRRSSISIPSNIAEGAGRGSTKDYLRFINIANGSLNELETQLLLAKDLELIQDENILKQELNKVRALLLSLRKALQNKVIRDR